MKRLPLFVLIISILAFQIWLPKEHYGFSNLVKRRSSKEFIADRLFIANHGRKQWK